MRDVMSEMDLIEELYAYGFSLIPIRYADKRPAMGSWKPSMERRLTPDELGDWYATPGDTGVQYNIGIVTGRISNVVVVDCDSDDAMRWADDHMPHSEMRVETAKGEHRYYRYPEVGLGERVRSVSRLRRDSGVAIDVRGDGGYVVGPYSVHETGVVYTKHGLWPPTTDLPFFDPAWVGYPISESCFEQGRF
jgi:putative DNA primase/helicase